jgi:hypothetical protein
MFLLKVDLENWPINQILLKEVTVMETAVIQKEFYCGVDLHAKTMFTTIMDATGKILFHRNIPK